MRFVLAILISLFALPAMPSDYTNQFIKYSVTNWVGARLLRKYLVGVGDSIGVSVTNSSVSPIDRLKLMSLESGTDFSYTNYAVSGAKVSGFIYSSAWNSGGACDQAGDIFLMQGGINDINGAPAETFNDVRMTNLVILLRNQSSNTFTIFEAVWPWTSALSNAIVTWNADLQQFCSTNRMCKFVDGHTFMKDASRPWLLNTNWTHDAQHPSLVGMTNYARFLLTNIAASLCSTSATVALADVKNAYTNCRSGDGLVLPSGAADWNGWFRPTNAIFLAGQGSSSTFVSNGLSTNVLLRIETEANKYTRVSGIGFRRGSQATYTCIQMRGLTTDARRCRIDNCSFVDLGGPVFLNETCLGVFDHNYVDNDSNPTLGYMKGNAWGETDPDNNTFGDRSASGADSFGAEEFFFLEDNTITNKSTTNHRSVMDAQAGARYVFRFNAVKKGHIESHGLEASRERSGRSFEIYMNTWDGIDLLDYITYYRGGVGLIYSNYVFGYTANPKLQLLANRLRDHLAGPFGGADGRNPWDTNNPAVDTGTASSSGVLSLTDSTKNWAANQWQGYVLRKAGGTKTRGINSMTRSGTTVTVTCINHGFTSNSLVSIFGADQQAYNFIYGYWSSAGTEPNSSRIQIVDNNNFKVENAWAPATPATGTMFACEGNHFSEILSNNAVTLWFAESAQIQLGPYSLTNASGTVYEINEVKHVAGMCGAGGGTNFAGVNNPSQLSGGMRETITGFYEWQNINCSSGPAAIGASGSDIDFSIVPLRVMVEGVHYFSDTTKSYTAYGYPHILVSGFEGSGTPSGGGSSNPGGSSGILGVILRVP